MEALSGVASGMAVASLSIQLVDSIVKIRSFVRDVKGASKELVRLANVLDQLKSLLEDVGNLMERQASLQRQHMPAPPATIVTSLESCRTSINDLNDIVERYRRPQQCSSSTSTKLKDDLKFGLRTKDIVTMEERIQRDYECLFMALKLNDTNILITMLPRLLQTQKADSKVCSNNYYDSALVGSTVSNKSYADQVTFPKQDCASNKRHSRESFKLTESKFLQTSLVWSIVTQETRIQEGDQADGSWVKIAQTKNVSFLWRMIGYGLHWQSRYPCGGILPSLRVFPVVRSIWDYRNMFEHSSARDVQELFHSGSLHPFTCDSYGHSLLYLAAVVGRADICRILAAHGLQYHASFCKITPLAAAAKTCSERSIDVMRTLLFEFEHTHCAEPFGYLFAILLPSESMWLWHNIEMVYHGEDLDNCHTALLESFVGKIISWGRCGGKLILEPAYDFLAKSFQAFYNSGNSGLLDCLFGRAGHDASFESHLTGQWFIRQLTKAGLSVELCMAAELKALRDATVYMPFERNRRVIFEGNQEHGWHLYCKNVYDRSEPGYLLLSEFEALGTHWGLRKWPFVEQAYRGVDEEELLWTTICTRANRRWEKKDRKASKVARKLLPRQQMPGTWIW